MAIGQRVPMVDAVGRVTGHTTYALNVELPGMLVGRILRSPHPHANITRLDTSRAARLPGVLAVVSRDDLQDRERFDPLYGPLVRDQPVLALDRARYAGEPVAAVAALDAETAQLALDLIEVEYEELSAVFDPLSALAPGAPQLHGETNEAARFDLQRGNLEEGFAEADIIVEEEFRTPPVQHVTLEPHVSLAHFEGRKLTVWSSTQTPFVVRAQLAEIFRLPHTQVRVIVQTLGGGYGGKTYPKLEPIAALLAWKARRPVKIVLDRSEVFLTSRRSASVIRLKTGAKRDGTLVARQAICYFDKGAYTETGPRVVRNGAYATSAAYRIPNFSIESCAVFTNLQPSGPFRAPGAAQTGWASECHLDTIARRLGLDPLELRRKNVVREGDRFVGGGELEDIHFDQLLDDAARAIGWPRSDGEIRRWGDGETAPHELETRNQQLKTVRGKAITISLKTTSTPSTSTAVCKLNEDGSLSVLTSSVEMGQGAKTALAQIAADAAGVPLGQVSISEPDTDVTPYDQTTSSSRTTFAMGSAIRLAGEDVRGQIADLAAAHLEVSPGDLVLADGRAAVKGAPDRGISYGELVRKSRRGNLLSQGNFISSAKPDPVTGEPGVSTHWHHAVGAAEVEVDTETGRVRVLRYHAGVFVGRIINPVQCELQAEGSVAFGLGQGMLEEMAFDAGHLTNPNLSDYMVPSFKDMPDLLSVNVLEEPGSEEIHGIGETALPPVAAAICNAVSNAVGVSIHELPITPERVLRALRQHENTVA